MSHAPYEPAQILGASGEAMSERLRLMIGGPRWFHGGQDLMYRLSQTPQVHQLAHALKRSVHGHWGAWDVDIIVGEIHGVDGSIAWAESWSREWANGSAVDVDYYFNVKTQDGRVFHSKLEYSALEYYGCPPGYVTWCGDDAILLYDTERDGLGYIRVSTNGHKTIQFLHDEDSGEFEWGVENNIIYIYIIDERVECYSLVDLTKIESISVVDAERRGILSSTRPKPSDPLIRNFYYFPGSRQDHMRSDHLSFQRLISRKHFLSGSRGSEREVWTVAVNAATRDIVWVEERSSPWSYFDSNTVICGSELNPNTPIKWQMKLPDCDNGPFVLYAAWHEGALVIVYFEDCVRRAAAFRDGECIARTYFGNTVIDDWTIRDGMAYLFVGSKAVVERFSLPEFAPLPIWSAEQAMEAGVLLHSVDA